jgi:hypothetical protein
MSKYGRLKPGDQLDLAIRQALEERVARSQPPEYGRSVLLARAREAEMARRASSRGILQRLRSPLVPAPVTSTLWVYMARSRRPGPNSHMSMAISSFTNPLLTLLR